LHPATEFDGAQEFTFDYLMMETLITPEIQKFVNVEKLGFIATTCPDGTPNLSPKGTLKAWSTDSLVFLDIHSPGTVNNLKRNPAIEINVVDIFIRKGYRFKGTAQVLSDGDIFLEILASYGDAAKKYTIKNVVLVYVNRILPITSPAYDTGSTESEIKHRWIDYWEKLNSE
jgi:predicted pyridoxine 5'-phosphate oxidase superfamily flavin-nucleotide-binding protein